MYESPRPPMTPRDIRRRAYSLMRRCWGTLLIAAVLMSLLDWTQSVVKAYGEKLATEAYNAQMQIYDAEKPTLPFEDDNAMLDDLLNQHRIERMAEEAYDDAFAPWEWLSNGLVLVGMLFQCIIAVGLCRGLLIALRGGECNPHCLRAGFSRAGTACWLSLQRGLRIFGWMLLPLPFGALISLLLSTYADFAARLLMVPIGLWAALHYALAEVHLTDDPYESCTAREALRQAVDDADAFGVWQMCKVLWPVMLPFALHVTVTTAAAFFPVLDIPALVLQVLCTLLILALEYACFVCIYDEMRQRIRAAEEAVPPNEGLARARALAANDE